MFDEISKGIFLKKENRRFSSNPEQMPRVLYSILEKKYLNLPLPTLELESSKGRIEVYDNLIIVVKSKQGKNN